MKGLMSIAVAFVLASASCDKCDYWWNDCETVNVDDAFWSANLNPESFDAALTTMELHPRSSEVFRRHSQDRFDKEQAKLLECGQLEFKSPAWHECHREADDLGNQGVLLRDIMRAIEGSVPFASSSGGMVLIFAKQQMEAELGAGSWASFIAQARSVASPLEWEFHESRW